MSENSMAAFRRGSERDRERRGASAGPAVGVEDLSSVDELLEEQRSAAALAAAGQVDQGEALGDDLDDAVEQGVPEVELAVEDPDPEPPAGPALASAPAPDVEASGLGRRVRRPAVYNLSPEVVRALRLLRVAREMDYPELIATAFKQAGGRVQIADDAVRKRTRFRGEKVTVELDPVVKEAIRVAAQERNMNASAFVTEFLELWVPKKALKGGVDL